MTATQPELPIFKIEEQDVAIATLVETLKQSSSGWLTRKEITAKLGWSERFIRLVAEAAGPQIIRGQKGLAHFSRGTVDEILAAANQSISQGKLMIHYGIKLRQTAHQLIGKT